MTTKLFGEEARMDGFTIAGFGLGTPYADGGEDWRCLLGRLGSALTPRSANCRRVAVASLLLILAVDSTATHAAVLCKTGNGTLMVRNTACRVNETAVDPAELGLLGLESKGTDAVEAFFYSYFMDTSLANQDFMFGQAKLQTTGSAGEFKVCGNNPQATGEFNYVVYVNGRRFAGTVGTGACTAPFKVGAGGDFQVTIRRAQIFGVHSGDVPPNSNYNVYGFSQLRTPL